MHIKNRLIPFYNKFKRQNETMISIIVPIYNVEKYLEFCLDSILNQTYQDFEVILVDDGSTDSSGQICDEYCSNDPRFRVIHQDNQGSSLTRNVGLSQSNGEYLYFLDSDDFIHPFTLEYLYQALQESKADISICKYIRTNQRKVDDVGQLSYQVINQSQLYAGIFGPGEFEMIYCAVWNKLYRREIIGDFSFEQGSAEDLYFNARVFTQCSTAVLMDNELYYYFINPNSITQSGFHNNQMVGTHFLYTIVDSYKSYNFLSNYKDYQALALSKLYRRMLSVRFYAARTEYRELAKQEIWKIRQSTKYAIWKNSYLPIKQKLILDLFYHFPWLYKIIVMKVK